MNLPKKVLHFINMPINEIIKKEFSFKKTNSSDMVTKNTFFIIQEEVMPFYKDII